jgi:membrane protease YdiL (CAAX protease family)
MSVWPETGLTETGLNIFYYAFGCVFVLAFLWKFLRRSYDALIDGLLRSVIVFFSAYMLDVILSYALQLIFMAFGYDLSSTPNDDMIIQMADQGYNVTFAMAVFLAPLVEEPLFRGLVFGGLRKKSRLLAYAASVVLFALYHVWQYVFAYADPMYLVYALNYISVSIALAYCYESSGSIWVPIAFHMTINAVSISIMSM